MSYTVIDRNGITLFSLMKTAVKPVLNDDIFNEYERDIKLVNIPIKDTLGNFKGSIIFQYSEFDSNKINEGILHWGPIIITIIYFILFILIFVQRFSK